MSGINPVDYSTMTVTSTTKVLATGSSPALPDGAHGALITVEDDQVRYRIDGTAPTASEGHLLNVGDVLNFPSWNVPSQNWRSSLVAVQFIRVTGDAKLKISWFD